MFNNHVTTVHWSLRSIPPYSPLPTRLSFPLSRPSPSSSVLLVVSIHRRPQWPPSGPLQPNPIPITSENEIGLHIPVIDLKALDDDAFAAACRDWAWSSWGTTGFLPISRRSSWTRRRGCWASRLRWMRAGSMAPRWTRHRGCWSL